MAFITILPSQVDAKSPVDDVLMQTIKTDLDDVNSRISTIKAFDYEFKINGQLSTLNLSSTARRLDGALVSAAGAFTRARAYLKTSGISGTLEVDIRKYNNASTAIKSMVSQYAASINSIAQIAPAIATQSVARATPAINTQSIARYKAPINISSIVVLDGGLMRLNLASTPDSKWIVGNSITIAGATAGANNITVNITRVNDDGLDNLIVANASAVAQTGAAGTAALNKWAYNFTNPVDAAFYAVGEQVLTGGHTSGANNIFADILEINSGGNNIIVQNISGVAQGSAAGTASTNRWTHTYASAVPSDFVVGEAVEFSGHTDAGNNANDVVFSIMKAVNSGGNNIIVYNLNGVTQAGAAGVANTSRFTVALPTNPTSEVSIGYDVQLTGTTSGLFDVTKPVKQVNRLGANNLVINRGWGFSGVSNGAVGNLVTTRKVVSFYADKSTLYTLNSRIKLDNMASENNNIEENIIEVNHGGGANYNAVIINTTVSEQASPAGRVAYESKSIFTNRPILNNALLNNNAKNRDMQYVEKTNSDFNSEATVIAGDILAAEFVSIPAGAPVDCVIQLI